MTVSNNAYFKIDDMTIRALGGKPLPGDWWSRPYEYAFALQFVDKKAIVADMGCGWMGRPLTAELARRCKEVYGIDADERVLDLERDEPNLYYIPMDFSDSEMDYFKTGTFDAIYCISVLEDLSQDDRLGALRNFKRLVTKTGKIIVTMDCAWDSSKMSEPYPTVNLDEFVEDVERAGLRFVGKISTDIPDNAVHQAKWNLSCFHCVLERA